MTVTVLEVIGDMARRVAVQNTSVVSLLTVIVWVVEGLASFTLSTWKYTSGWVPPNMGVVLVAGCLLIWAYCVLSVIGWVSPSMGIEWVSG